MKLNRVVSGTMHALRTSLACLAMMQFAIGLPVAEAQNHGGLSGGGTQSPIKHVIVIIGENRSFDHVFATYIPKHGQSVDNLLSKGIVKLDSKLNAIPGPHFDKAQQLAATDAVPDTFLLSPPKTEFPGNILPSPLWAVPRRQRRLTFPMSARARRLQRDSAPPASPWPCNRKTACHQNTIRHCSSEARALREELPTRASPM